MNSNPSREKYGPLSPMKYSPQLRLALSKMNERQWSSGYDVMDV